MVVIVLPRLALRGAVLGVSCFCMKNLPAVDCARNWNEHLALMIPRIFFGAFASRYQQMQDAVGIVAFLVIPSEMSQPHGAILLHVMNATLTVLSAVVVAFRSV